MTKKQRPDYHRIALLEQEIYGEVLTVPMHMRSVGQGGWGALNGEAADTREAEMNHMLYEYEVDE